MAAVGVVLVVLGGMAGAALVQGFARREPAVVVTHTVPAGSRVQAGDVATALVAVEEQVRTVPAEEVGQVVGRRAAVTLQPGSLLSPSQVTRRVVPPVGRQLVTMALKPGQVPVEGLHAGAPVALVYTPGDDAAGKQPAQQVGQVPGRIHRVGRAGTDGLVGVDVLVATRHGARVARWAAADAVALVLTPRGS